MVDKKITNEKILKVFNAVKDEEAKAVMLKGNGDLCSLKFLREHEDAFRSVIPAYFDKFKEEYRSFGRDGDSVNYVVGRENFILYACLQHGVIDPDDFTTVVNFATVGVSLYQSIFFKLSSVDIFKDGLLKLKDGDKKLLEFIDKNPQYLDYFLPLICAIDSESFSQTLSGYMKTAGLEDTIRIKILEKVFKAKDANILRRFLDEIDDNNYYRFKAMSEACVSVGDYTVVLTPKEMVAVLRDVANDNCEKYLNADFKRAYHFINSYDRVYEDKFHDFAVEILKRGGDRAKGALLYSLSSDAISCDYAQDIFSCDLTLEDLAFFDNKIHGDKMPLSVAPFVFEKLFGIITSMDKVNYHFKVDDDITFARDLSKSTVISALGEIALKINDKEYFKRLDSIYDTLKEEAQAYYLRTVKEKTTLDIRRCAIKFLKTDEYSSNRFFDDRHIKLNYDEAVMVSDYLKSKKESVKSKIIKAYLSSKDSERISEYLLSCKEDYKKSVGEEMQKSQGKVDNKKLEKKTERFYWCSESVFKVDKPSDEINKLTKQKIDIKPLEPIKHKRLKEFFECLRDFIQANKDYEYAADLSEGLQQFGSRFERLKGTESGARGFDAYPLGKEIEALIKDNFTQDELAGIIALVHCVHEDSKSLYCGICGNKLFSDCEKNYDYVRSLRRGYYFNTNEYNIVWNFDNTIVRELLGEKQWLASVAAFARESALDKYKDSYWYPTVYGNLLIEKSEDIQLLKTMLYFESVLFNADVKESVDIDLTVKAYEKGLISDELARYFILKHGYVGGFFSPSSKSYVMRPDYEYPKFKTLIIEFIDNALELELSRGSLETPYSALLCRVGRFYGVEKFCKTIVALRGLTWSRSPYGTKKDDVFSYILKSIVKVQDDTYDKFVKLIEQYKITDEELLKATLFNPEFVDYTARYFGVPYLKTAVFWFIAHLNETLRESAEERRIERIKEFSDISYPDFKDGAFDFRWYEEMIEKVPQDVLKQVYDNAKYVTVGGLHKRAQRFFDAVNGQIDKAECIEKINSTRNKDYCLIYSLIPIENREDLHERYTTLAEFMRGSKQFGAQRQLSERRTVDIAMENLARVAGYASADIFIFEMEAENPSDIYKTYAVDNITITPYIDESKFKIAYKAQKDGKSLSAIPSKYGKNPVVVEIREQIKTLNQKFRRIIISLEKAMNTRTPFTVEQLRSMSRESIIAVLLSKTVFLADGRLCVFDGDLKSIDGKSVDTGEVFIAHPVELKKLGLLQRAIEYVVKNNIRQPFKQVMREIYVKTELELEQDEVLRFKGFEVDLKKCVAALKGKGWGVSEDIGLRKVHYRADVVSAIFREFDLFYTADFTNENRELHGVFFLRRKSGEIIPIKDVDDVTFSETLRDVDLMISISSKVIYDFDLAMSTVEMRQEVLKSIVGILGLTNVSFLKDNIKVDGKWGTYVINIRTGLVFKEGKGNLALDTVYSVDKQILLHFVYEDPR
ncbi:MAG: DUF4132 domain-containing protein, partial [Clostridia bacterium]|nr:DUF4132 domain-containing protein [Clostridia bacterium]